MRVWSIRLEIKSPCDSHISFESFGSVCHFACIKATLISQLLFSCFWVSTVIFPLCYLSLLATLLSRLLSTLLSENVSDCDLLRCLRLDQPYCRLEKRHSLHLRYVYKPLYMRCTWVGRFTVSPWVLLIFLSIFQVQNALGFPFFFWTGQRVPEWSVYVR